ncbi:TMhelix containing protein [Vibrio phage 1.081.O._10N.286.52.C2]|nr:TMhelix containing protein [Vibrio phage 1.081.O._10N.286.52.C2]
MFGFKRIIGGLIDGFHEEMDHIGASPNHYHLNLIHALLAGLGFATQMILMSMFFVVCIVPLMAFKQLFRIK